MSIRAGYWLCSKAGAVSANNADAAFDHEYVARAVSEWTWSGVSRVEPLQGLDPGIAPWVELLRAWRIETHESCQGGPDPERPDRGHAYPAPTIAFGGGPETGFRAYAIALTHALPVYCIRRVWKHQDHELTGPVWEMVFNRQATPEEYDEVMHTLAFERGEV
jgi:hypothetical protein